MARLTNSGSGGASKKPLSYRNFVRVTSRSDSAERGNNQSSSSTSSLGRAGSVRQNVKVHPAAPSIESTRSDGEPAVDGASEDDPNERSVHSGADRAPLTKTSRTTPPLPLQVRKSFIALEITDESPRQRSDDVHGATTVTATGQSRAKHGPSTKTVKLRSMARTALSLKLFVANGTASRRRRPGANVKQLKTKAENGGGNAPIVSTLEHTTTQDTTLLLRLQQAASRSMPASRHEDALDSNGICARVPVLPSSRFSLLWNVLHLLALCYVCTVVPYITALPSSSVSTGGWTDTANRAVDGFYIADIVVNLRTPFVDAESGALVYRATAIARNYARGWLAFDALMAFPFDLLLGDTLGDSNLTFFLRIFRLIRLAKLLRVMKTQSCLDFCEDALGIGRNKLMVVQLVLSIFLVAHLTACGFILAAAFGRIERAIGDTSSYRSSTDSTMFRGGDSSGPAPPGVSWIDVFDLTQAPPHEVYVASLYWAFTMMTTVGFGDIVPITLVERIYSILAMVISAGTYAYVIASMSSIVSLMNLSQTRHYEKINELNAYMASRRVPAALQLRTRHFFRYYLQKKTVFDESALFDVLPSNLREELVGHYIATVMCHIAFFHDVEKAFTAQIALELRPVFFPPQSLVVRADDPASELFVVSKGTLLVTLNSDAHCVEQDERHRHTAHSPASTESMAASLSSASASSTTTRCIAVLHDGDHFGEMALVCTPLHRKRLANVVSQSYCELSSLRFEHVEVGMARFPLVRKKLVATAHARLLVLDRAAGGAGSRHHHLDEPRARPFAHA